jgi:tryptophanyl-tRNA synthetase
MSHKQTVLTGDRPTGKLHLGHFVGSIQKRLEFESLYQQFVMVADVQALTDNAQNPEKVRTNVIEVALDNIAAGLDPAKTTFFIQSAIPEIAELTVFFLNLVTLARLERNPTVKEEMKQKGFGANVPAGFLCYPISQAADILSVQATIVPVGEDQLPVIEQANEIVDRFNSYYGKGKELLPRITPLVGTVGRLPGIDGKAKMSKSLNNAIYLSDSDATIKEKVKDMYTDPNHIKVEDPGTVKGNTVFAYLDAFDPEKDEVAELKKAYQKGGLGDVALKDRLARTLINIIGPIREKREYLSKNPKEVMDILESGTEKTRTVATETLALVKEAMHINYF